MSSLSHEQCASDDHTRHHAPHASDPKHAQPREQPCAVHVQLGERLRDGRFVGDNVQAAVVRDVAGHGRRVDVQGMAVLEAVGVKGTAVRVVEADIEALEAEAVVRGELHHRGFEDAQRIDLPRLLCIPHRKLATHLFWGDGDTPRCDTTDIIVRGWPKAESGLQWTRAARGCCV